MYVNLLSESLQRRALIECRAAQWMKIWFAALLAAVGIAIAKWPEARAVRRELELAELRSAPVVKALVERDRLKAELARTSDARTKLRRLAPDTVPLGLLGLLSEAARSSDDAVQIRSVEYAAAKRAAPAAKEDSSAAHSTITIHGLAADEATAARFVEHLRLSPRLRHVELKGSSRASSSIPAIQFDVVCDL